MFARFVGCESSRGFIESSPGNNLADIFVLPVSFCQTTAAMHGSCDFAVRLNAVERVIAIPRPLEGIIPRPVTSVEVQHAVRFMLSKFGRCLTNPGLAIHFMLEAVGS